MRRVPNVREIVSVVRSAVDSSQTEKRAAASPEASMTVDVSKTLIKVASEIRSGSFAPVTYNEVMEFGSRVKEAVSK